MYRKWKKFLATLPPPLPITEECVYCPWCGTDYETVTIGDNYCECCRKGFVFRHPEWAEGFYTYVHYSHREVDLIYDSKVDYKPFKPNERLEQIYEHFGDRMPK